MIKIGVINISDRASAGEYEDLPGKEVLSLLNGYLKSEWEKEYAIIPDEQHLIEKKMIEFADDQGCCLIITTGGTGPTLRDVTPEATESVSEKMMPGFGELMRTTSQFSMVHKRFDNKVTDLELKIFRNGMRVGSHVGNFTSFIQFLSYDHGLVY